MVLRGCFDVSTPRQVFQQDRGQRVPAECQNLHWLAAPMPTRNEHGIEIPQAHFGELDTAR